MKKWSRKPSGPTHEWDPGSPKETIADPRPANPRPQTRRPATSRPARQQTCNQQGPIRNTPLVPCGHGGGYIIYIYEILYSYTSFYSLICPILVLYILFLYSCLMLVWLSEAVWPQDKGTKQCKRWPPPGIPKGASKSLFSRENPKNAKKHLIIMFVVIPTYTLFG